jgi:hypothetical protein
MKKQQLFAAGTLAVLLLSDLAACGSTGPSKAELERQEQIRQEREQADLEQRVAQKAEQERLFEATRKDAAAQRAIEEKAETARKAAEERQAALDAANVKGVTAEDFDYDVTRDGTGIVIMRYKGMATIVNIPATIEGLPVKEIGGYVMEAHRARTYFGDVDSLGVGAFFATSITSITIPDSVISIVGTSGYGYGEGIMRGGVFANCRSLKSVTLSRNLKVIPARLFSGCTSLEAITLPAGLQSIGESAFERCTSLETIAFPDSLTTIEDGAYAGCLGLTALVLPKNLKILGNGAFETPGAFQSCTGLESVTFQSNNLEIAEGSFSGCTALSTLNINANIRIWKESFEPSPFEDCPITTVNIGPAVTSIRNVDQIPQDNLSIASKAALRRLGY